MTDHKRILWNSLLLTILIFAVGILLNHVFDVFRISTINDVMRTHETSSDAYRVERLFSETFGEEQCTIMISRISTLKKEIRQVGEDLGSYSRFSLFRKKDYDYLKRKYFLLELRFLATVQKLNNECGKRYLPILFFYEIDNDESERQGFILQELSEDYEQTVVVLAIDKDYQDEPLVNLLKETHNITTAPTTIINDQKYVGLHHVGELNQTILDVLRRADPHVPVDFHYTPRAAGINITRLLAILNTTAHNESADSFARGDAQLIIGRLTNNDTRICESLTFYDRVDTTNPEERALLHETSASLGCGRNRNAFLKAAAQEWETLGNHHRADILTSLLEGRRLRLRFDEHALTANDTAISGYATPLTPALPDTTASAVVIGNTTIRLNSSDVVVTQADRVHRDWLGGQIANPYGPGILTTFSERLTYPPEELRADIGWHEGARLKELKQTGLRHYPAVGTLVARKNNRWFAMDGNGTFRFEVPLDKLSYPTTRFLREDLAVIIDTHGVNMIAEQAIRYNTTAVLSDCDHPGKVYAAQYLSDNGVAVICYPDKYAYLALGHNLALVGSPPSTITDNTTIIGNRPLTITTEDTILAINSTDDAYALWYYQTPASYFNALNEALPLSVSYYAMTTFGQMHNATQHARAINATVLATRVFNSNDYTAVKQWLDEDITRKAILFHTASYPYGQKLLNEYPDQTSFDDPNPVFV